MYERLARELTPYAEAQFNAEGNRIAQDAGYLLSELVTNVTNNAALLTWIGIYPFDSERANQIRDRIITSGLDVEREITVGAEPAVGEVAGRVLAPLGGLAVAQMANGGSSTIG